MTEQTPENTESPEPEAAPDLEARVAALEDRVAAAEQERDPGVQPDAPSPEAEPGAAERPEQE